MEGKTGDMGTEMLQGKKKVKHRNILSLFQRQGDGGRQGRDWSRDTRCRGTRGIQGRTEQGFTLAEAIQSQSFPHTQFQVVYNFPLSSSNPQITLKAVITH